MNLHNTFEVPLPPDQAWALLRDIERIAPCMPGAAITEVVGPESYKGTVALRLGPVSLSFAGRAEFTEMDDAGRRARVKAQGADTKGRGGAVAEVGFQVVPAEAGSRVEIDTDLNLSGSIAQYGRGPGIIQATAEELINQFADNLRKELGSSGADAGRAPTEPPEVSASEVETSHGAATPASEAKSAPEAKPISGFSLMFKVLWTRIKRLFGAGS